MPVPQFGRRDFIEVSYQSDLLITFYQNSFSEKRTGRTLSDILGQRANLQTGGK